MPMLKFIEAYRKNSLEDDEAVLNERIKLLFEDNVKQLVFGYYLAIVLTIEFLKVLSTSVVLKWLIPLTVVYVARYYLVLKYKNKKLS